MPWTLLYPIFLPSIKPYCQVDIYSSSIVLNEHISGSSCGFSMVTGSMLVVTLIPNASISSLSFLPHRIQQPSLKTTFHKYLMMSPFPILCLPRLPCKVKWNKYFFLIQVIASLGSTGILLNCQANILSLNIYLNQ